MRTWLDKLKNLGKYTFQVTINFLVENGSIFIVFIVIFILLSIISLNTTITSLATGVQQTPFLGTFSHLIISAFQEIPENNSTQYRIVMLETSSMLVKVLSGVLLILSIWVKFTRKYNERTQQKIITKIINNKNDELEIMNKYYKNADRIVAFSGDFSFINEHDELKRSVLDLASSGRITLISYKSEGSVKLALEKDSEFYHVLKNFINYNSNVKLKASLIKRSGNNVFLYSLEEIHPDNTSFIKKICILTSRGEAAHLIGCIESLTTKC